ncbi:MAG: hydroxyisourate hydrolase [Pseudomonadota bacterium]
MAQLTTHVLDTANGCPAAGMTVRLLRVDDERSLLTETTTNGDGRVDRPLLTAADFATGRYALEFDVAAYFLALGTALAEPPFLDTVTLNVGLCAGQKYHVPLLVSPWSYSTYRGS